MVCLTRFWRQKSIALIFLTASVLFIAYLYISPCKPDVIYASASTKSVSDEEIRHVRGYLRKELTLRRGLSSTIVYAVTPTYARSTQKADLTRLSHTLMHVPYFHWIVVEDSKIKSNLVSDVLKRSGINYTHLCTPTQQGLIRSTTDPRWRKHRGVDQRNLGLQWIRMNVLEDAVGVVYFADDDNTYSLELFEEMRWTKKISMWPVALVGGLRWEGPICEGGKVVEFFTAWRPERAFPMDMAGFAISTRLLFEHPDAYIDPYSLRGYLESDFLSKQLHLSRADIEAKADNCRKILVWHTQTVVPDMKKELYLEQFGLGSDRTMEI